MFCKLYIHTTTHCKTTGDSTDMRDLLLASNIGPPLIKLLSNPSIKITMKRNVTWTLSNLCRGKADSSQTFHSNPNFALVRPFIAVLAELVQSDDQEVVTDATYALAYLAAIGENDRIEAVVQSGVVPLLVQHLGDSDNAGVYVALQVVSNIVTGTESQTQSVLDAGALHTFVKHLSSGTKKIRKKTCLAISNITAGTTIQIDAVINAQLIPPLIAAVHYLPTRKEAVLSIANLTSGGSKQHIECLVEQSVIKPLSDLLTESTDTEILTLVLDTFSNLLKAGLQPDGSNPIADIFKECGAMEKIGECQSHRFFVNENVCEKAVDLIETYFGGE